MKSSLAAFFDHYIFVHTHIEKCGGSTLLHYLTALLDKEHSLDLRPFLGKRRFRGILEVQKKKQHLTLLSGHFPYNSPWTKLVSNKQWAGRCIPSLLNPFGRKQALYVASIRHPIHRLDSLFRYLRTRPRHHLYNQHVTNNDFNGFIQALVTNNSYLVNNGICAQLTRIPPGPHILEEAKKSFDHHYLAIVPYDKTHALGNMLANVFQLPMMTEKTLNKSAPGEKAILNQEMTSILEEKCHDDIQLYHYVLNGYQVKLASAEKYLRHLLNEYKA